MLLEHIKLKYRFMITLFNDSRYHLIVYANFPATHIQTMVLFIAWVELEGMAKRSDL